jgi:histone H3/H4
VKSLKEIKYYQKRSDCLFFSKKPFRGLCRETAEKMTEEITGGFSLKGFRGGRFSVEAVLALQMAAEKFVSDYLSMAYIPIESCRFNSSQECTFHRKAATVIPKDMHLVRFFYNSLGGSHPLIGTTGPPQSVG